MVNVVPRRRLRVSVPAAVRPSPQNTVTLYTGPAGRVTVARLGVTVVPSVAGDREHPDDRGARCAAAGRDDRRRRSADVGTGSDHGSRRATPSSPANDQPAAGPAPAVVVPEPYAVARSRSPGRGGRRPSSFVPAAVPSVTHSSRPAAVVGREHHPVADHGEHRGSDARSGTGLHPGIAAPAGSRRPPPTSLRAGGRAVGHPQLPAGGVAVGGGEVHPRSRPPSARDARRPWTRRGTASRTPCRSAASCRPRCRRSPTAGGRVSGRTRRRTACRRPRPCPRRGPRRGRRRCGVELHARGPVVDRRGDLGAGGRAVAHPQLPAVVPSSAVKYSLPFKRRQVGRRRTRARRGGCPSPASSRRRCRRSPTARSPPAPSSAAKNSRLPTAVSWWTGPPRLDPGRRS